MAQELQNLREFYEATAQEAGIQLFAHETSSLETALNRALFQRALGNLITNAIAHTPPGGTVILQAIGDAANLAVKVTDTGGGIPADHLPHVFDRFYRPTRPRTGGGLGLGLAIVKSIVELHGGTVALASEIDKGTEVRLNLPRNSLGSQTGGR